MSTLFLILQGGMVGFLAHEVYPDSWEFFAVIFANAVLVIAYGFAKD